MRQTGAMSAVSCAGRKAWARTSPTSPATGVPGGPLASVPRPRSCAPTWHAGPPAFVRNRCGARHLNIAHGLYPREALPPAVLDNLAAWLRNNVGVSAGRTYAGGLTKFEPKELERIPIPKLERLHG